MTTPSDMETSGNGNRAPVHDPLTAEERGHFNAFRVQRRKDLDRMIREKDRVDARAKSRWSWFRDPWFGER